MRYWIVGVAVIFFLAIPASALDFKAPNPPESAIAYMPDDTSNFGEGLAFVIREAISKTQPEFTEAVSVCSVTVAVAVALGMLSCFTEKQDTIFHFGGTLITAMIA